MPRGAGSIKMSLSGVSSHHNQYINAVLSNRSIKNTLPSLKKPTTLKSPMISRVNGVNAGCGSCGRK
jgi:hypothetical protein